MNRRKLFSLSLITAFRARPGVRLQRLEISEREDPFAAEAAARIRRKHLVRSPGTSQSRKGPP